MFNVHKYYMYVAYFAASCDGDNGLLLQIHLAV